MFKDVPSYETYEINLFGEIRNKVSGKFLKPMTMATSRLKRKPFVYHRVTLCKNGVPKKFSVSRLVAYTFIGEPTSLCHEVNHKDGDRNNNHVSNLEWVSPAENKKHAELSGLLPKCESHGNNIYTEEQARLVITLSKDSYSRKQVSEMAGVTISFVKDIRNGRAWKHLER